MVFNNEEQRAELKHIIQSRIHVTMALELPGVAAKFHAWMVIQWRSLIKFHERG